jgi:hypothetical protein
LFVVCINFEVAIVYHAKEPCCNKGAGCMFPHYYHAKEPCCNKGVGCMFPHYFWLFVALNHLKDLECGPPNQKFAHP